MMEVKIESFHIKYLSSLLSCWNENLPYDVINEQRFYNLVLLDDNFDKDLLKIALDNEKVVGFCYGIKRKIPYLERGLESERGWISIMAVDTSYRRLGIGKNLLQTTILALQQLGSVDITLCAYSPNYFTPGIDVRYSEALAFVEKFGFIASGEAVSMKQELWDYTFPMETKTKLQELKDKGIHIQVYEHTYMQKLLDFILVHFGAGWKRNALLAMQHQEAHDTIILCVNDEKEILGFCMRKIDGNEGRFGPFGVREDMRSHGIGGVLYECMMQDMRERGIYASYFLWTSGAAQRFYERHQVSVYRTYNLYRKVYTS